MAKTAACPHPLLTADARREVASLGSQVAGEVLGPNRHPAPGDVARHNIEIGVQPLLLGIGRLVVHRPAARDAIQQEHQFAGQLDGAAQARDDLGQPFQVPRVKRAERDGFAAVGGHVEAVVPVRPFEPAEVVLPGIEERRQVLDQHVLEDRAAIDGPALRAQAEAVRFGPPLVAPPAAVQLRIAEVLALLQQEAPVAGLVHIEKRRVRRPHAVVHPRAGNVVPVGDELAGLADDRRIRAVDPHAAEVVEEHRLHGLGLGEQEREAVLPEVAPAAAAAAVVELGQE